MTFIILLLIIASLVALIVGFRLNAFLAFVLVSILSGLVLGIPLKEIIHSVEKGLGDTLGSLVIIISTGAMLGKIIAESGAAQKIAQVMIQVFGLKYIQWALMITGFIIGIPLYYGIGFVLMVPLIFSVVFQYKLPAVATGLPMLAALSVTHGFLPPHPSPSALVVQFHANMGITLMYGLALAIPSILLAGLLYAKTLKNIASSPLQTFMPPVLDSDKLPSTLTCFLTALLPVFLLIATTAYPLIFPHKSSVSEIIAFVGEPAVVMLISLIVATFSLGIRTGKKIPQIMGIYTDAVKDVAMILLIIAGAGALKQVFSDSGVNNQIANLIKNMPLHPLVLGWMMAAIIRACIGSATIAGLTAAGVMAPILISLHTDPNLMVLAIGSGSIMFSHVNDSGFWLFKEYFNISVKDTFISWSVMESIIGLTGLAGVLCLNMIIN